jgi:hypothetical protein
MWNQARIAAAAFAIALAPAPFAFAQTSSPAPTQGEQRAQPDVTTPVKPDANVPDEKLDKAAAAISRVVALKQTYTQKLQTAPDGERQQIADEAKTALTRAVTDQGLSIEEYSNILQVAENDTGVRDRILKRLHSGRAD